MNQPEEDKEFRQPKNPPELSERSAPEVFQNMVKDFGPLFYILDENHEVIPATSMMQWAEWFQNDEKRRVGFTNINGFRVSTVFIGLDHAWDRHTLHVFETMVFEDPDYRFQPVQNRKEWLDYQRRYATWDEAAKGHEQVVTMIREGLL